MGELSARSDRRRSGSKGNERRSVDVIDSEPDSGRVLRSSSTLRGGPTTMGLGARRVVEALQDRRIDPAPLLAQAGLQSAALDDRSARVPAAAEAKLIEVAAEVSGDPTFGLQLAARAKPDQAGLVSLVLSTTPCLRDTIKLLPRYAQIVNESARCTVAFTAQGAIVELRYFGLLRRDLKHATEYLLASTVQALRDFTGYDFSPVQVSFAHLRRDETRTFERFFRCPVIFGAEVDQLIFSKETLDLTNRRADRYLFQTLQPFADEEITARDVPAPSFREAVDNKVFGTLARGEPTIETIAQALAVSPRTLSRRLAEEGTTFPEVLTTLRRSLAAQYIQEPGLSIDQIALLLGYSEIASFSHAFRRWTGQSPSAARRVQPPLLMPAARQAEVHVLQ